MLPKKYYEKRRGRGLRGQARSAPAPIWSTKFQQNAFLRLKANPNYWGGKPAFDTVVYKFVPDATSRVAELESVLPTYAGDTFEEFDRLKERPDFAGYSTPISDIAMIFLNDIGPMLDKNVRLAASYAIDKKAIVDRLLRGYGVVIDTLQAPEYMAFDAAIKFPTTRQGHRAPRRERLLAGEPGEVPDPDHGGFKPKDYEMIQAIVGMWRRSASRRPSRSTRSPSTTSFAPVTSSRLPPSTLGQLDRRPDHVDRLRHVRSLAALGLGRRGPHQHDRPAVGRGGRAEAHRGLEEVDKFMAEEGW